MRDSFVFYRSFFEAIQCLEDTERNKATWYIVDYALNGNEPAESKGSAFAIYLMAKPQIDANNHRFENGKRGGRPKSETKTKPNDNQNKTKAEPNVNVNENVNVNDNELINYVIPNKFYPIGKKKSKDDVLKELDVMIEQERANNG